MCCKNMNPDPVLCKHAKIRLTLRPPVIISRTERVGRSTLITWRQLLLAKIACVVQIYAHLPKPIERPNIFSERKVRSRRNSRRNCSSCLKIVKSTRRRFRPVVGILKCQMISANPDASTLRIHSSVAQEAEFYQNLCFRIHVVSCEICKRTHDYFCLVW